MKWKRDKKKKTKGSTGNTRHRGHGSKDGKRRHSKHRRHSKRTAAGEKKYHHHRPTKPMPKQPPPEENLGDIVLVKDMKKRQMLGAGSKEQLSKEPMKDWKLPSTPGLAYRSVENLNKSAEPMVEQKKSLELVESKRSPERKNLKVPAILGPKKPVEGRDGRGDTQKPEKKKSLGDVQAVATPSIEKKKEKEKRKKEEKKEEDDDLTRKEQPRNDTKELAVEEKKRKWKYYIEDVLNGKALRTIDKEWTRIRGYLPLAATREDFDAHSNDNRFVDIVCIDQTRVSVEGGKYLNASWVEIDKTKKMILAQLPLRHTASHFWQMILETRAQGILLLLTRYEYEQFAANATFPQQQDFLHYEDRHIRVGEFKRIKVAGNYWTMSVLSISNGDQKRYLHLHHYSGWVHGLSLPDHLDLLRMQSAMRKYKDPLVVMSLSGCGRAGTYASFEVAHNWLHSDMVKKIDVPEAVQRVKDGRMHAVQRPVQLKTIHLALIEHILNNGFGKDFSKRQKNAWEELQRKNDDQSISQ